MKNWLEKNIFWGLAAGTSVFAALATFQNRPTFFLIFGALTFLFLAFALYFNQLSFFAPAKVEPKDPYKKLHYTQSRRRTFKVINGGKSESLRRRTP